MADIVFNIAKGRVAELAALGAANDEFVAVVLESSGLEADAVLQDYDDLASILAGTNTEQTVMGRKVLTNVAVVTNDTDDRKEVDADDITWTAASGNATGAVLICYDGDNTSGTDANITPLVKLDMAVTPSGGDITLVFNSGGFYQAS